MVLRAPSTGGVKVYDVSSRWDGSKAPSWDANPTLENKKRVRRQELSQSSIDILQDLEFPNVSSRLKITPDQQHILATGTYPPQLRIYDVDHLSMKTQRNVEDEIVDFQILTQDWTKVALLFSDRSVCLHAQFGIYYTMRVPTFGRQLAVDKAAAEVLVASSSSEIYRINLELGRFMQPWITGSSDGNNCIGINPSNRLIAVGGANGCVEIWDPRSSSTKQPAGALDVMIALSQHHASTVSELAVHSLRFDPHDTLKLSVGTSKGEVLLFDIRSPRVVMVKEHGYGLPVHTIKYNGDGKHVTSSDAKSIRIWDKTTGANHVIIECKEDINHVSIVGDSGVIFAPVEAPKMRAYYIPSLGLAPKWCSFLDNLTEELEETGAGVGGAGSTHKPPHEIYENLKFVSREELDTLQIGHLIGTNLLRPYMHGFFMDFRLYRKALEAAEPFAYEQYKKEQIRKRLEQERESRIGAVVVRKKVQLPEVNPQIALQILQEKAAAAVGQVDKKKKKSAALRSQVMEDDRFRAMFENKDFQVEEADERYKQLHPTMSKKEHESGSEYPRRRRDVDDSDEERLEEEFALVADEDDGNDGRDGGRGYELELDSSSSEDISDGGSDDDKLDANFQKISGIKHDKPNKENKKRLGFYEMKDPKMQPLRTLDQSRKTSNKKKRNESLGERLEKLVNPSRKISKKKPSR